MLRVTHSLTRLIDRVGGVYESSDFWKAVVIGSLAWLLLILVLVAF
jgi:hypothetical protein